MNTAPNILIFGIVVTLIFVILDVYVLTSWSRFTKRNAMHPLWRRIPWILSAVFVVATVWVFYRRHAFRLDGFDAVLFGLSSLWFLPKFGIVLVLLLRDVFSGAMRLLHWKGERKAEHVSHSDSPLPPTETSRRAFLGKSAWSLAAVPYVMVGNGMWRTLYDYRVYPVELTVPTLPAALDGITIVQISDIHAGSYIDHRPLQEARRIIDGLRPDAIVITGDFVNSKPSELSVVAQEIAKIHAPMGVFATLGNHDHYHSPTEHRELVSGLRTLGLDLLINEHRRIGTQDASLVIAGVDNIGFRQRFGDVHQALHGVADDEPTILLAHDPTLWDREIVGQTSVDVMLSGHTHGGQFGVQALGFEWSPAQYVYEQWAGLYRKGQQVVYVNRGLGTVGPPIRIGIPPEITMFTLRAPSASAGMA